jgi:hypothetical protein
LWIELEPSTGGEPLRILAGDGLERLRACPPIRHALPWPSWASIPTMRPSRSRTASSSERERRRELAERDARILARTGPDPELAGLAEYAAGLPRDLA